MYISDTLLDRSLFIELHDQEAQPKTPQSLVSYERFLEAPCMKEERLPVIKFIIHINCMIFSPFK